LSASGGRSLSSSSRGSEHRMADLTESAPARFPDESSDSEPEQEPGTPQKLIRKVSTSGQIRSKTVLREGNLMKQTNSFQRWKRRYFKLRGRTLYYAQTSKSIIFDEVDLTDASVAESSTKNVNNSFTTGMSSLKLYHRSADSQKKTTEPFIRNTSDVHVMKPLEKKQNHVGFCFLQANPNLSVGTQALLCSSWTGSLSGVTSHGLSCEVCKFKAHKRCAVRATNNCKWTTLASIGKDIIEDEDGVSVMPISGWRGTWPVSAKCNVCDKNGSVLRLQDWRCLWCKAMVHSGCKEQLSSKCPLGQCKVSVIPPTALNSIDSDGFWKASCPPSCTSPLLVFVNSKSGDNQGVKFLRRFKQLLNPAQVFDLMNGGPHLGLRLFQKFDTFRILVCGGDGSVGWVLSEIDALTLHKQCQLGVLPLGTGNDLARVLGWGSACDDDTQLPQILEKLERASTKMLDRWRIMVYETKFPRQHSGSTVTEDCSDDSEILTYEDSVAAHLSKILTSDQHSVVISSARVLCETVKDLVARVGKASEKNTESSDESELMAKKVLKEKLDSLLKTLNEESQACMLPPPAPPPTIAEEQEDADSVERPPSLHHHRHHPPPHVPPCSPRGSASSSTAAIFKPREQLMLRANSLKKAIRQIMEHTERAVDEQNLQTQQQLFTSSRPEEDEGFGASLQSSSSRKHHSACKVGKTPCEKLISKGGDGEMPTLNTKILYSGLRGISVSLSSSSVISQLLVNADPFSCDPDNVYRDCYTEKCVMNNYFGIGLDAKISLDFNNKRDEHPEKCRSRTKNMMWYGVLGTKELLHRTYKNLEQKVLLEECDGRPIPLPSLQGIAVLNIPSYAGGTNFWGGTKEDDMFTAPSFDDKILEVVAVFGSMQMAVSRVINLQHHRITQCRTVKIKILGDEGVPVQVDGEAWVQPPGYIKIIHKNRTQTLTRDLVYANVLFYLKPTAQQGVQWVCMYLYVHVKKKTAIYMLLYSIQFIYKCASDTPTKCFSIREVAETHHSLEQELAHAVNASSKAMDVVYANSNNSQALCCSVVLQMVSNVKALLSETELLLAGKMSMQLDPPQQEQLKAALSSVAQQLRRLADVSWLSVIEPSDYEVQGPDFSKRSRSTKFRLVPKFKKDKNNKNKETCTTLSLPVHQWGTEEVGAWLGFLSLNEYQDIFMGHDVRGAELIHLERRDLKDLGVTKVGHIKRILHGIRELNRNSSASEA
uniref:Diacylglycerol kinase n=1 Tax=Gasterosteus aculeatus TaxID=69293 RepID=G3NM37_GASAC